MAVVIRGEAGPVALEASAFNGEEELELALAASPGLLKEEGDASLAVVRRQVVLSGTGKLDVLMVDADGVPVVVEVKLARNGESRREVVAQIVDYVASLTMLTVDELDGLVGGDLEMALRSFDREEGDESGFEPRWKAVGDNLRSGRARIVLVLDDVSDDLLRIVRFLADHSDFDVRLVAVTKYPHPLVGPMFVPRMLLSRDTEGPGPKLEAKVIRAVLGAVVSAYDQVAAPDLRSSGTASRYRQIHPNEWPSGVRLHYEFVQARDQVAAELHLENTEAAKLAPLLMRFAGRTVGAKSTPLVWDPTWSKGRGRLTARYPLSEDPEEVAQAMRDLIALTRGDVGAALGKGQP